MRRLVAVVVAVTMVGLAIVIRSAIDGDGSGTSSSSGPITIACITELATQCNALRGVTVRIEEASVTAKAVAKGTAGIDGWVTFDPWPAMTDQLAGNPVTAVPQAIARTDLAIAMVQERAARLAPSCGGAVNWRCLGDTIGKPWTDVGGEATWGTVKAGVPPISSASGVLLLGNAASGFFGRSTYATNDFDADFIIWRQRVTSTPASYTQFIQQFPALFSAVGALQSDVATMSGDRPVATIDPSPSGRADVVITAVNGGRVGRVVSDLKNLFKTPGWSTDRLDEPTGLPDPGVLLALSGLTG